MEEDVNGPRVRVGNAFERSYAVGSKVLIPKASASDVLSDVVNVTVTVTLNGVAVKDENGVTLENVSAYEEYEIELGGVGEYVIVYKAKDSRGAESVPVNYVIRAIVEQNPVITVSGNLPATVKVSEEINLPEFSVNYVEENENNLNYAVYITPNNEYFYISEGKFIPERIGIYKIRYFALDIYGNYSIWEKAIEVTQ
jgi:hypothetical protein